MRLIDADALKGSIDCGHLRPPTELCFSELDVCNMIDKAPTIGGWIPCSERLPEKHTRCLVTWESLFGTLEIDTAKYGRMWLSERKGDGWYIHGDEMDTDITDDVIAWMPLPPAYKEEADE